MGGSVGCLVEYLPRLGLHPAYEFAERRAGDGLSPPLEVEGSQLLDQANESLRIVAVRRLRPFGARKLSALHDRRSFTTTALQLIQPGP
jgi:hypothetical protein